MTKQSTAKPTAADARAAALKAARVRVVKAGAGRTVGLPSGVTVNGAAAGTTFATWLDGDAKRRAWLVGDVLVIDARGITADAADALARTWNAKAKPVTSPKGVAVFAKGAK